MRTFLRGAAVILGVILLAPASTYGYYLVRGYYVLPYNADMREVIQQIIADDPSAQECRNIRLSPFTLFRVKPLDNYIAGCIMNVARHYQDASACELLMPSEAGLICVGGATRQNDCILERDYVYWMKDGEQQRILYSECPREFTREVPPDPDAQCCYVALTTLTEEFSDCSPLSTRPTTFDECQSQLAFKLREPGACVLIQDEKVRAACTVRVRAIQQDPSICRGCTKPFESVEELLEVTR